MADSHLPPSGEAITTTDPAISTTTTSRILPVLNPSYNSHTKTSVSIPTAEQQQQQQQQQLHHHHHHHHQRRRQQHAATVRKDCTDMPAYSLIMKALKERGCYTVDIKGDGNCLFRSLAEQMYGDPERHRSIRLNVISCIEKDSSRYTFYVPCIGRGRRGPARQASNAAKSRSAAAAATEAASASAGAPRGANIDAQTNPTAQLQLLLDHCKSMRNDGEWGDYLEIAGFAHAYGKRIFLYQEDGHVTVFKSDKPPAWNVVDDDEVVGTPDTLHIAYHSYRHYSSVRRFDGPKKGLPNRLQSLDFLLQFSGVSKEDLYDNIPDFRHQAAKEVKEQEQRGLVSRTKHLIKTRTEAESESIYNIFPEFDRNSLTEVLKSVQGDKGKAINILLEARSSSSSSSGEEITTSASSSSSSPSSSSFSSSSSPTSPSISSPSSPKVSSSIPYRTSSINATSLCGLAPSTSGSEEQHTPRITTTTTTTTSATLPVHQQPGSTLDDAVMLSPSVISTLTTPSVTPTLTPTPSIAKELPTSLLPPPPPSSQHQQQLLLQVQVQPQQSLLRASFNAHTALKSHSRPSSRQSQFSVGSKRSASDMEGYEEVRWKKNIRIYDDDEDDDEETDETETSCTSTSTSTGTAYEDDGEYVDEQEDDNDSDDYDL
ncbi:hypothetical protein KEM54_001129 [Ascosphaera aggregata]|nr:hypothetical protein KEM54_001129 [Ascosphaera aggregata]